MTMTRLAPVRMIAKQTVDLLCEARRLESTGDEVDARLARAICWQVVVLNDGLARRAAKRWGSGEEEDRLQVARLGLLRAAAKWDPSRGCTFATLAHWWCRAALVRELPALRLKPYAVFHLASIKRAEEEGLSGAALAERCGLKPRAIETLMQMRQAQDALSIDALVAGTDRVRLVDVVAAPEADGFGGGAMDHHRVAIALDGLPQAERDVLVARYGLDGGEALTYAQIGASMGCSREWVRVLEYRALERIRKTLGVVVPGRAPKAESAVECNAFAVWCRAERERLGMSQQLMAERLGTVLGIGVKSAETNLSRVETGRVRPKARWREAIERILKWEAAS